MDIEFQERMVNMKYEKTRRKIFRYGGWVEGMENDNIIIIYENGSVPLHIDRF